MVKFELKPTDIFKFIKEGEENFIKKVGKQPRTTPRKRHKQGYYYKRKVHNKTKAGQKLAEQRKSFIAREIPKCELNIFRNKNLLERNKKEFEKEKLYYDIKRQAICKEWYRLKNNIKILNEERCRLKENYSDIQVLQKSINEDTKRIEKQKKQIEKWDSSLKEKTFNDAKAVLELIKRCDKEYVKTERLAWLDDIRSVGKEDSQVFLSEEEKRASGESKRGKYKKVSYDDCLLFDLDENGEIPDYGIKRPFKINNRRVAKIFDKDGNVLINPTQALKLGLTMPRSFFNLDSEFLTILVENQKTKSANESFEIALPYIRERVEKLTDEELICYASYNIRKANYYANIVDNSASIWIGDRWIRLVSQNVKFERRARQMLTAIACRLINERKVDKKKGELYFEYVNMLEDDKKSEE